MLAARWRLPVVVVALVAGITGGFVACISQASAAVRAGAAVQAGAGGAGGSVLRIAASQPAPLVTDAVTPGMSEHGEPAPAVTGAMRQANLVKQASARAYVRSALVPATRMLAATQQAQVRNYFCGPAAVSEMLAQLGARVTQRAAARQLGTNSSGTDWSDASGYPVPRVLNAHQRKTRYVVVPLPWTPASAQLSAYETDLVSDLNKGAGIPLAGNAYEVPGGPHLVGHPAGQTIMHWFDIRGYSRSGAITSYEDSVHGAPSIAWGGVVPAYSTLPSATIVDILGARGYVW